MNTIYLNIIKDLADRQLQTEIIIDPSDFDVFNVICDVELTFNFRELKVIKN